jgi:hypothetical protein
VPLNRSLSKVGTPLTSVKRIGAGDRVYRQVLPPWPPLDLFEVEHGDIRRLADLDLSPVVEAEEVGQLPGEIMNGLFDGE